MKKQPLILLLILFIATLVNGAFADQAPSIRVQMYNANLAVQINTIYPWYRLTNTGSTPVKLADVKIRYFYTIDGEKPQNFWCDWSSVGSANVTGTFVKLETPSIGSDYYFELGFKTGAGYLQPGRSIDVQSRFAKNDWSNYNQNNDYSFNSTDKQYVDWDKITVLVGDNAGENFVTSSDYTQDNQWVRGPVAIHLTVNGQGSTNATPYYTINGSQAIVGNLITLSNDGIYRISFWAKGHTSYSETPHVITVKIDQAGPSLTGTIQPIPNASGWVNTDATVTFMATDALSGVASVTQNVTISTEGGGQTINGQAADNAGNVSTTSVTVNLDKTRPEITNLYPGNGLTISHARPMITVSLSDNLSGIDPLSVKLTIDGDSVNTSIVGNQLNYIPTADLSQGRHTISVKVNDMAGNVSPEATSTFIIDSTFPNLPPDPSMVAPKLDTTICTSMVDATKFLYTGDNPIQTGVVPDTIQPQRVAVLRGKVLDKDGQPLPGVKITVLNHPEYGQTYSRSDGIFDLVVNGGGYLTVKYERTGYLRSQRQINVPWQDYVWMPEVILIQFDAQVTEVTLNSTEVQVARGSIVTDKDGTRQATIIFPEGVQVSGFSGKILHIRATELTVGENGPKMMPADLPPTSGYTYCVEISADELNYVQFNKPVYIFVENFLNFLVGGIVPTGYYDREKGEWIASKNGKIISILGVDANGLAQIDVDGSGQPASTEALNALGFTDQERLKIAYIYSPGQSLWRVPITHFTPWDHNWPYGPPPGAQGPNDCNVKRDQCSDIYCTNAGGSMVEIQNQILHEDISVYGTPFTLHYASDWAPGRTASNSLVINLSGNEVPPFVKRIELTISVAGQIFKKSFLPSANLRYEFIWNGMDAYGRRPQGDQQAEISVSYVYPGVYQQPAQFEQTFGAISGDYQYTKDVDRLEVFMTRNWHEKISSANQKFPDLGGWTPNIHHTYDPKSKVLHLGNGQRRSATGVNMVIKTIAGTGEYSFNGDGMGADQAAVVMPDGIVVAPDGSIYIADSFNERIRRIGSDGIITTIAGTGEYGFSGDGGPATQANLACPMSICIDRNGDIYIADYDNNRIRKVGRDGIITTIAGTGEDGFDGDGGPAVNAKLSCPRGVAAGPDGSVYIADSGNSKIRRVNPNGIITTIAGMNMTDSFAGDGGPAYEAALNFPTGVAVGPDGSVYVVDSCNNRIRKIGTDGIIETIAGSDQFEDINDGGPAINAGLFGPQCITVGPDGSIYFSDSLHNRIRRVGPDGIIYTIAGKDGSGFDGDGGNAMQALLNFPKGVALGPDGNLYIADYSNNRVRRVAYDFPGFSDREFSISSEDGHEIYRFDANGKHLSTINALTGSVLYKFTYDDFGNLTCIQDGEGNVTTIERNSNREPTAIISPYGQRTGLTLDAQRYLSTVTNSAGETIRMTYYDGGLLKTFVEPKGQVHQFMYDTYGRLAKDEGPTGGYIQLTRLETDHGYQITESEVLDMNSAKTSTYLIEYLSNNDIRWVVTGCCGGSTETIFGVDGVETITSSNGNVTVSTKGPDPRFGMQAPILKEITVTTPGGLVYTQNMTRSVTLANPDDLLSVNSITDTITINGRASTSTYDANAHTITSITPMGRQSVTTLDEKGHVIKAEVPGFAATLFAYDDHGRLKTTTQGFGSEARVSSITYDDDGRVESVTNPLLQTTHFEYDAVGRVTKQTLPNGQIIQFSYDANGKMITLTPPGRPEHSFSYNATNLTESYTPPMVAGTGQTSYEYNLLKQPTLVTRPDGQSIGFEYDTMGRLITLTLPNGEIAYTYDPKTGHLANVVAQDGGALTFGYDGELPTSVTWAGAINGKVGVTYNNDFSITTQSINNGQIVSYAYNNDGQLTHVGDLTAHYDPQNGSLTGSQVGNVTDAYSYTSFGEVQKYSASVNGFGLYSSSFIYDKLGRISTKTETVNGQTYIYVYGYDLIGQLTDVWKDGVLASHYDYDSNGNRIGGTYDAQDRMTQYGGNTYQYAANGELWSKISKDGTTSYIYDVLGNLTSVTLPIGIKIDYVVDGANRRIGKKVNGVLIQGWLYQDDLKPVAELNGNGNVVARFIYGTNGIVPDYMIKNGVEYRIISDHLGSPRLVVDSVTGQVAQRMDYDEFGNVTLDTNPGFQPFGFAGGLYDRDTKLVRFGARDYDAETGRWTVKDQIGFLGGDTNIYSRVSNDPSNYTDPSGNIHILAAGAVGALYGVASTIASDVIHHQYSGWQSYVSNAAGGFVGGMIAVTGNNLGASAASSFVSIVLNRGLRGECISGEDMENFVFSSLIGGFTSDAAADIIPRGSGREPIHFWSSLTGTVGVNTLWRQGALSTIFSTFGSSVKLNTN